MLRFPPRRILVAVEFSKASLFAWDAAKEIAVRFNSTLEAVWCAGRSGSIDRADGLRRLRARLGPDARLHAAAGEPVRTLRRLLRDGAYDLLVVGTHRRRDLERAVQGSVAEAVVRDAPCPVLVVPRAWSAPRWVLAPVHDGVYARRGLLSAAVLARAYRGRLAILEIIDEPAQGPAATKRMGRQFDKMPCAVVRDVRPELDVRVGDPVREILRGGRGRDLIVLVAHRKSVLGDLVRGTTVERVIRRSIRPVLAIPS